MSSYAIRNTAGIALDQIVQGQEVTINLFAGTALAYVNSVGEDRALAEDEAAYYPLYLENGLWCCASVCTKEAVQKLFSLP